MYFGNVTSVRFQYDAWLNCHSETTFLKNYKNSSLVRKLKICKRTDKPERTKDENKLFPYWRTILQTRQTKWGLRMNKDFFPNQCHTIQTYAKNFIQLYNNECIWTVAIASKLAIIHWWCKYKMVQPLWKFLVKLNIHTVKLMVNMTQ